MSALTVALKTIEAHAGCQPAYWLPQLSVQEIESSLQNFPFKLPKEVYELYLWHNGTLPKQRENEFTPEYFNFGYHLAGLAGDIVLYSLEEAMFWWQARDEWNASFLPYEPSNVFPLFAAERGNIVVLGSRIQQESSPIYWVEDLVVPLNQEPLYPSLTHMMLAIAEAIESGARFWDSGICDRLIYETSCRAIDEKYGRGEDW
jgi:hypothetical protein